MVMASSGGASHEKEPKVNTHTFTHFVRQGPSPLRARTPSKGVPGSGGCGESRQRVVHFVLMQVGKKQN